MIKYLERVFRIQHERQAAERAEEQQRRSELLNRTLAWLSIAGVATMVSAVLDLVWGDSAETWSSATKLLALALPTVTFAPWVWYMLRSTRARG